MSVKRDGCNVYIQTLQDLATKFTLPIEMKTHNWDCVQQNHRCDVFSNFTGQAKEQ